MTFGRWCVKSLKFSIQAPRYPCPFSRYWRLPGIPGWGISGISWEPKVPWVRRKPVYFVKTIICKSSTTAGITLAWPRSIWEIPLRSFVLGLTCKLNVKLNVNHDCEFIITKSSQSFASTADTAGVLRSGMSEFPHLWSRWKSSIAAIASFGASPKSNWCITFLGQGSFFSPSKPGGDSTWSSLPTGPLIPLNRWQKVNIYIVNDGWTRESCQTGMGAEVKKLGKRGN